MDNGQTETPSLALSLSHAHSVALTSRMLCVEEDCREIDRCLDGYVGIYSAHQGVLPDEIRQTIRALIAEILRGIDRIRRDLGLPQRQIEVERMVAARLSRIWVTLCESRADSLRGYGVLPEELKTYLDPRVDEILALHARLSEALRKAEEHKSLE